MENQPFTDDFPSKTSISIRDFQLTCLRTPEGMPSDPTSPECDQSHEDCLLCLSQGLRLPHLYPHHMVVS